MVMKMPEVFVFTLLSLFIVFVHLNSSWSVGKHMSHSNKKKESALARRAEVLGASQCSRVVK